MGDWYCSYSYAGIRHCVFKWWILSFLFLLDSLALPSLPLPKEILIWCMGIEVFYPLPWKCSFVVDLSWSLASSTFCYNYGLQKLNVTLVF